MHRRLAGVLALVRRTDTLRMYKRAEISPRSRARSRRDAAEIAHVDDVEVAWAVEQDPHAHDELVERVADHVKEHLPRGAIGGLGLRCVQASHFKE